MEVGAKENHNNKQLGNHLEEGRAVHRAGELYPAEDLDDDGRPKRTGTFWTASAHIVTAVIGSGVLSLAWSMAKLGWVAGPIVLLAFGLITYFTSLLLADSYRSPPLTPGACARRNYTYKDAVQSSLGETHTKFCATVQYTNLVGITVGYTITASLSMAAIVQSNCFHMKGHQAQCPTPTFSFILLFGGIQVILSQISTFSKLWWLSIVAAIMSFSYSSIGVALGVAGAVSEGGHLKGTAGGLLFTGEKPRVKTVWPVFQALGNIAFAYSYSTILIEIQDTIKSPPPENRTMKKANLIGVSITTVFYMLCGCIGYAVFGAEAPGNLLTEFGFYEPYWLLDIANACVVVHLVGAYQVFAQPVFAFLEERVSTSFPKNELIHRSYRVRLWCQGPTYNLNLFRLMWRTAFVMFTTLISMLLPFFNAILGVLGALAFWPLTVYFPIEMHITQCKTPKWSLKWVLLKGITFLCLLVSLAALVGSIDDVVESLKKRYKPFKTHS